MSDKVLELVMFKLAPGAQRERFMEASDAVSRWVSGQPGFISRELSHDAEGDRWIDVVWWRSLEEAQAAAERAMSSEDCAPMIAMTDMESVLMVHGDLVASTTM
jgi:antibiotic biosynthesis monooxygenase (ABM) superfamily enzyme